MPRIQSLLIPRRLPALAPALVVVVLLAVFPEKAALIWADGGSAEVTVVDEHGHCTMTDTDMARWVTEYYATHPRIGTVVAPLAVPADTVFVSSFIMNSDGNLATQFDTVTVIQGASVLFQWVSGSHTTTSGTGPLDPQAGALWDQPMTSTSQQWVQPFPDVGIFPFFCRPHPSAMHGWVNVISAIGAVPLPVDGRRAGFLADPFPNPTTGSVSFRFALSQAGHARADVVDVRGRLVAVVLDQDLGAGSFAATWDGRAQDGARAAPGVYRLRLRLPGREDGRKIVLQR